MSLSLISSSFVRPPAGDLARRQDGPGAVAPMHPGRGDGRLAVPPPSEHWIIPLDPQQPGTGLSHSVTRERHIIRIRHGFAPGVGLEPTTYGLTVRRSAN